MPMRQISEVIRGKPFLTVSSHTCVREAADLMKSHHVGAVMVVDGKKVLKGICSERDIVTRVVAARLDPEHVKAGDIMTSHPCVLSADKPFGHALHIMYEGGYHHVPVVDAKGRPIGLLTARDALGSDALEFEHDLERREEITAIL